jgi:hypothetical protein
VNLLDSLKRCTTVVADTGDVNSILQYRPQDGTTNPSLLYQAARKPEYAPLIDDAIEYACRSSLSWAARRDSVGSPPAAAANDELRDGIRKFHANTCRLERFLLETVERRLAA